MNPVACKLYRKRQTFFPSVCQKASIMPAKPITPTERENSYDFYFFRGPYWKIRPVRPLYKAITPYKIALQSSSCAGEIFPSVLFFSLPPQGVGMSKQMLTGKEVSF